MSSVVSPAGTLSGGREQHRRTRDLVVGGRPNHVVEHLMQFGHAVGTGSTASQGSR